jgi:mediator of RNA polymerase II transcription subunit 6
VTIQDNTFTSSVPPSSYSEPTPNISIAAMAPTKRPAALDEIVEARPDVIEWWMQTMGGPHMDVNMIHRYFYESNFFDHSTKNGLFISQAATNAAQWEVSINRRAFEDNLRQRPGLEYMIVGEPQPVADKMAAAQGATTGIYVIRKQDRQRAGPQRSTAPGVFYEGIWEVTTLATYFIAGIQIYQAPSVFDAVGNRLLSAAASLNRVVDIANGLPRFTPSMGYHYLPQTAKRVTAAGSVAGSPTRSREGSVVPGGDAPSARSGSVLPNAALPATTNISSVRDARLLIESFELVRDHGDEYTDENPLSGEPGNFKFATSTAAVKKRRADEEAAAAKARAEKESASTSRAASPEKAPSPPAVFTEAKTTTKGEKSGKTGGKIKRRKSKVNGTTNPSTPVSSTSTHAPSSALK